ncbi:MAG: hypothetical protein DI629_03440 [Mesorhizobium amorphae]|nr:MAG: hypothetical protein DI629_03440 [Mesorhizobium amorphae]
MAKRYFRKLVALAKVETTYGVDSVPTAAANGMLMQDVTLTPLEAEELGRELLLPHMGHQGVLLSGFFTRLEGSVELAGSGTAGTAPAYGPLLRACGMSQVVTASTRVDYQPVSSGAEAVSIYYNRDGTLHAMLGARGSWRTELGPNRIPRLRFNLLGLHGPVSDAALPNAGLSAFRAPVPFNKDNSVFTLHGFTLPTESIMLDLGNQVEKRDLINDRSIEIVDRRATGSAVLEATQVAQVDWLARAKASTLGAASLVHGSVAGNIIEFAAPNVQIGRPSEGQTQGILNNTLPLMLLPTSSGNDELTLRVR